MSSPVDQGEYIPTRIAFQVPSRVDSRTVLDRWAPSSCWGRRHAVSPARSAGVPVACGCVARLVADHEVHKVVSFLNTKKTGRPVYDEPPW